MYIDADTDTDIGCVTTGANKGAAIVETAETDDKDVEAGTFVGTELGRGSSYPPLPAGDYFLKVHLNEFWQTAPDHGSFDGGDYQLKIRPTILTPLNSDQFDSEGKNLSLHEIGGFENAPHLGQCVGDPPRG